MLSLFKNEESITPEKKEKYINKLKQLIVNNEQENKINLDVIAENYFEFEFKDVIKKYKEKEFVNFFFKLNDHQWSLQWHASGIVEVSLLNLDIEDNDKPVLLKFVISFRRIGSTSHFATLNVSSLYCYTKKNSANSDDYIQDFEDFFKESIKPLIKFGDLMMGIYIRIYSNDEIDKFSKQLKSYISTDIPYKIKNENFFEKSVEDCMSTFGNSIKQIEFGGYRWLFYDRMDTGKKLSFYLSLQFPKKLSDNEKINASVVIYVRNPNDYTFSIIKPINEIICFTNKNFEIKLTDINMEDLFTKNEDLNKCLVENKCRIYGLYIRIYETE